MMILIGADIVPTKTNADCFMHGNVRSLIGKELMELFDRADYRILNLEVPLTDTKKPIKKFGPNLAAAASCAEGLKDIGIDLLTLANNHIMDQSEEGLYATIHALEHAKISYVGVGKNISEACKPFYFNIKGKRYGVYACTEHEFSVAEENRPGANPFEALESPDHVVRMKSECDYAIVLYHGGKEHYRYPSPYLQKVCRKMVEKGADLVVCQHSHCIGCEEKYLNGTIVYGQGNFLFDMQDNEYWNSGLLIGITDEGKIEYCPIVKNGNGVRLAKGEVADSIMHRFMQRSTEAADGTEMEKKLCIFADQSIDNYLLNISGISYKIVLRALNKLSLHQLGARVKKRMLTKYYQRTGIAILNYTECEAHRELLLKGLKRR